LEDVQDYSTKISELNKLNETLQKRISTLESQGGYEFITDDEIGEAKRDELKDELKERLKSWRRCLNHAMKKLKRFKIAYRKRPSKLMSSMPTCMNSTFNKEIEDAQNEITKLKSALRSQNESNQEVYTNNLKDEINKLKQLFNESTREIESQKEELLHKQETIDTLNTQIIDLYKSMEENSNKLIEKEDELVYLQEICDTNKKEIRKAYEKISTADKTIADLRNKLSDLRLKVSMMEMISEDQVM
jgi:chromosome segregation ATPase